MIVGVAVGMIAVVARSHWQSEGRAHDPVNRLECLARDEGICEAWFNIQLCGLRGVVDAGGDEDEGLKSSRFALVVRLQLQWEGTKIGSRTGRACN